MSYDPNAVISPSGSTTVAGAGGGGSRDPNDLTVQQEAFLLHMIHAQAIKDKLAKEAAQLKERQQKIKFIHEIMQDINNAMDDEGNVDLNKHPELKQKLQAAEEHGVKMPGKDKLNGHESRRLLDNLNYTVDDWSREDATQMRKMQNLYMESEQSIMIAKHTMSSMDKPIRTMISGIKGG